MKGTGRPNTQSQNNKQGVFNKRKMRKYFSSFNGLKDQVIDMMKEGWLVPCYIHVSHQTLSE